MNHTGEEANAAMHAEIPKGLREIPPCPRIATRILQLAGKDDTETDELVELIRSDTAFAGRVLQLANSAQFGQQQGVDSVQRAVPLVGHAQLRKLAVGLATEGFNRALSSAEELQRCWVHTLVTSKIAEELADSSDLDPDEAYTLGLLHDVGCLAMLARFPEEYTSLLREAEAQGVAEDSSYLLDREAERFGIDHCYYGAWVAAQWDLPIEFRQIAGRHHDRPEQNAWDLQAVLQLSSRLADGLGFGALTAVRPFGFQELRAELPEHVRDRFWVDEEAFTAELALLVAEANDGVAAEESQGNVSEPELAGPDDNESETAAPAESPTGRDSENSPEGGKPISAPLLWTLCGLLLAVLLAAGAYALGLVG